MMETGKRARHKAGGVSASSAGPSAKRRCTKQSTLFPLRKKALDIPLGHASHLEHTRGCIPTSPSAFEELWDVWDGVAPTPNPYNPSTHLHRRQATIGGPYAFAGQTSQELRGEAASLRLVTRVNADVAQRCDPQLKLQYTMLHINWYPDGRAGMSPHADDEGVLVPGANIYSYTFLSDAAVPRPFQVYTAATGTLAHEVVLGDGDLLVMGGQMQRYFTHGVKASAAKKFEALRRINVTVRAVVPARHKQGLPLQPDGGTGVAPTHDDVKQRIASNRAAALSKLAKKKQLAACVVRNPATSQAD